jgi:hypothetical protein
MRMLSSFLALALSTSATLAADVAPLSPGAPAGVKHAQAMNEGTPLYVLIGVGAIAAAIGIISATHSNGSPASGPSGTIVGSSTTATV